MTARSIIYPGSFGDSTLPRMGITFSPPLAGARYDWDTNNLSNGPLAQWTSSVDGAVLASDGTAPIVLNAGIGKSLAFDGITGRMSIGFSMTGPHAVVAVYRLTGAPVAKQAVHFGKSGTGAGALMLNDDASGLRGASTTGYITPSPVFPPDNNWHISILTVDGTNSTLRIDDNEWTGNIGTGARDGITLGFSGGTPNRTPIEYKRVAIIPGATTGWQRNSLVAQMRQRYGM